MKKHVRMIRYHVVKVFFLLFQPSLSAMRTTDSHPLNSDGEKSRRDVLSALMHGRLAPLHNEIIYSQFD